MKNKNTFTGYYKPKNKSKYVGNKNNIYFRSSWERAFCKWCDINPKVKKWVIEPFYIRYFDEGKKKARKYYPDFWVEMEDNTVFLFEIKPKYETLPPKMKPGTPKYILQEATYITNISKWNSAKKYCEKQGWHFEIVTENTMDKLGIKLLKKIPPMKRKGTSKKNVKYANKTSYKKV